MSVEQTGLQSDMMTRQYQTSSMELAASEYAALMKHSVFMPGPAQRRPLSERAGACLADVVEVSVWRTLLCQELLVRIEHHMQVELLLQQHQPEQQARIHIHMLNKCYQLLSKCSQVLNQSRGTEVDQKAVCCCICGCDTTGDSPWHPKHNLPTIIQPSSLINVSTCTTTASCHLSPVVTEALDWPQAGISEHPVHVCEEVCCSTRQRVQLLAPRHHALLVGPHTHHSIHHDV